MNLFPQRRAPVQVQAGHGITFTVDDVPSARKRLTTTPLREDVEALEMHAESDVVVEYSAHSHGLACAVHRAFADHRPLVLTPDAIWLTIAQGFSHHVRNNAEALRDRFVAHAGKRTLEWATDAFDAAATIRWFSESVREYVPPKLHAALLCDFSTSTLIARTASEIVVMDTFQPYFVYRMVCICGIPTVTLEGTVDDWRRIRARLDTLAEYDLEWWIDRVRPIADELVATAEGKPSRAFWKAIYKPREQYGAPMTGWLTDLYPYLGQEALERNHTLEVPRRNWALSKDAGVGTWRLPRGRSKAPIRLTVGGERRSIAAVSGFFGAAQDEKTGALRPNIGWAIVPASAWDQLLDEIEERHETVPGSLPDNLEPLSVLPESLQILFQRYARITLWPGTEREWVFALPSEPEPSAPFARCSDGRLLAYPYYRCALVEPDDVGEGYRVVALVDGAFEEVLGRLVRGEELPLEES